MALTSARPQLRAIYSRVIIRRVIIIQARIIVNIRRVIIIQSGHPTAERGPVANRGAELARPLLLLCDARQWHCTDEQLSREVWYQDADE